MLQDSQGGKARRRASTRLRHDGRKYGHMRAMVATEGFGKMSRSKTLAKRPQGRMPHKTGTEVIDVSPSQFVLQKQGILNDSYEFVTKIGQGSFRDTIR